MHKRFASYRPRRTELRVYGMPHRVSELFVIRAHDGPVLRVGFGPLGRRVVTASLDGTARLFDIPLTTQALIDHAKAVVPRALTACERQRFFLAGQSEAADCPR